MSVTANAPSDFIAQMQDNGNPISLPDGSEFVWATDDDTDQIVVTSEDPGVAQITVVDPPADRTDLTVTVSAVDPSGETIEGSLTVDIIAGVTHTYTIAVSQPVLTPAHRSAKPAAAPPAPAKAQAGKRR